MDKKTTPFQESEELATGKFRPSTGVPEACQITGGVLTYTRFYARPIGEGTTTDDLDTINGGVTGDMLLLASPSGNYTVTVKDGTGNIQINTDCALVGASNQQHLLLMYVNSAWRELLRSQYA